MACSAGACLLTADAVGGYSGAYVNFSTPFLASSLTQLSIHFQDLVGGVGAGSPRIVVGTTTSDFFIIYPGPPPSFIDPNPITFTASDHGKNQINGSNNTAIGNGNTYQPYSLAVSGFSTALIDQIYLVMDGAVQSLLLHKIKINGESYDAPSAQAVPGPMVGAGIPGIVMAFGGFLAWRRRKVAA